MSFLIDPSQDNGLVRFVQHIVFFAVNINIIDYLLDLLQFCVDWIQLILMYADNLVRQSEIINIRDPPEMYAGPT